MMNIDTSYFIYHDLGYEENIITLTMAKKIFFEKYLLDSRGEKEAGQALEKQIIRAQQIKISYLDAEHKRIRCRLPYLGYERLILSPKVCKNCLCKDIFFFTFASNFIIFYVLKSVFTSASLRFITLQS